MENQKTNDTLLKEILEIPQPTPEELENMIQQMAEIDPDKELTETDLFIIETVG